MRSSEPWGYFMARAPHDKSLQYLARSLSNQAFIARTSKTRAHVRESVPLDRNLSCFGPCPKRLPAPNRPIRGGHLSANPADPRRTAAKLASLVARSTAGRMLPSARPEMRD